jgi:hypothetical protein
MENPLKAGQALGTSDLILAHSRWVTRIQVVVGSVHPVLTGLHVTADEAQHHRLSLHAKIHGFIYHPEELGDVVAFLVARRGTVPVGMMLGQMAGVLNELRWLILDVEPLTVPLRVQFLQFEDEVVLLAPLAQLKGRTSDNGKLVWNDIEEMAPQVEMGTDPQDSFTKMDVQGQLKNGIRVEMDQL